MSKECFLLQADDSSGFLNECYSLAFVKFISNDTFQGKGLCLAKSCQGRAKIYCFSSISEIAKPYLGGTVGRDTGGTGGTGGTHQCLALGKHLLPSLLKKKVH